MMQKYLLLVILMLAFTCCETENKPSLDPLLFEKNFCPYVRLLDTYCNGDKAYQNDEQWIKVMEDLLATEGVDAIEIKLGVRAPVKGVLECPCGAVTGHYADVLVSETDKEKLLNIGLLALVCEN